MYITLALAIVFIYLVLAAQFESFLSPLVIMITVPLAFTGALILMWFFAKIDSEERLIVHENWSCDVSGLNYQTWYFDC